MCGEGPSLSVHPVMPSSLPLQPWTSVLPVAPLALGHLYPSVAHQSATQNTGTLPTEVGPAYKCFLLVLQAPSPLLEPSDLKVLASAQVVLGPCWAGKAPSTVWPRGWGTLPACRGDSPADLVFAGGKGSSLAHHKFPVINSQPYYLLLENHSWLCAIVTVSI